MIEAMIAYHSEEKFKELHAGMMADHEKWFEGLKAEYLKKKKFLRSLNHKKFQDGCDIAMVLGGITPAPAQPAPTAPPADDGLL